MVRQFAGRELSPGFCIFLIGSIAGALFAGGLFSVAYTDVFQGILGWSGLLTGAFWFIAHEEDEEAQPPSIGFPGEWTNFETEKL